MVISLLEVIKVEHFRSLGITSLMCHHIKPVVNTLSSLAMPLCCCKSMAIFFFCILESIHLHQALWFYPRSCALSILQQKNQMHAGILVLSSTVLLQTYLASVFPGNPTNRSQKYFVSCPFIIQFADSYCGSEKEVVGSGLSERSVCVAWGSGEEESCSV